MKKLLVLALATGALILGLGVSVSSAGAACGTKCLSKKEVKSLQNQVATLNSQLSCISASVPVTQYDGYDYLNTATTTALDLTDPGDPVLIWVPITQPGTCGLPTVRTAAAGGRAAPGGFTPFQLGPPQTKK
jgi:hypothetical protein